MTGASSGLGRQIAISAAAAGAQIVVTGRDETRLAQTMDLLEPRNGHQSVIADLTSASGLAAVIEVAGNVHGVVHAAGIAGPIPVRVVHKEFIQARFEANFFAPILLTQKLLAGSNVAAGGSILFMSSIAAHTGYQGMAIYSATKSSLVVTAKCLALEVAKRRIRVNCLSPAVVRTPIFTILEKDWLDQQEKRYPLGLGTPEDVANAAVFFLADASRWITGQALIMDGACPWI